MKYFTSILFFLLASGIVFSQMTQEEYIKKYSELAVKEMKRAGVPASITLAQGIIESASGNSYLAREGNNHFGIKCHKSWQGERIYTDDDAKNECFRKYKTVEESYQDHSDFLRLNSRYHFLFELEITDYVGWSNGLKQAGYATNPNYANSLISMIEKHKLYEFDTGEAKPITREEKREIRREQKTLQREISFGGMEIFENNGVSYIIVQSDIILKDLAKELDLMAWQLARYNDLQKDDNLKSGNIIYIKPKKNNAAKTYEIHQASGSENLWDISQKYAVKLNRLKKYNNIENAFETLPKGTKVKLRSKRF